MLEQRVKDTRPEHYTHLRALTSSNPPERIIKSTIRKCIMKISPPQKVSIYIIIGFFSADGFTIKVKGKPVIGFGLERMNDFSGLDIISAHEYAHFFRLSYDLPNKTHREKIINEGIATLFSQIVFPRRSLPEHLFMSNAEFNRLLLKKNKLLREFNRKKGNILYQEINEPRRVKNFIGYFVVEKYLKNMAKFSITDLLKLKI